MAANVPKPHSVKIEALELSSPGDPTHIVAGGGFKVHFSSSNII